MASLEITEYAGVVASRLGAEREEAEWLLTSGVLGRSANLARVLRYVCKEYFAGRAEHIKEYTIAVEALGRRPEFDPQTDTIVRVTVHALRKRLSEIYRHEGASRPVRLILPSGHYVPSFLHQRPADPQHATRTPDTDLPPQDIIADEIAAAAFKPSASTAPPGTVRGSSPIVYVGVLIALAALAFGFWEWTRKARPNEAPVVSSGLLPPAPKAAIHALMGHGRAPYVDHSGNSWTSGDYCQAGTSISVPNQPIEGTQDASLYLAGVRGIAHCVFPVLQGTYELHLHFAETSDLPVARRVATLSINASPALNIDVVDDSGGRGIATSTTVTGVVPENDGSIHLDFVSEVSLLNAVEILPSPSTKALPIRIVANTKAFVDERNQVWASDSNFIGGRYGQQPRIANSSTLGIYQSARIGRFRYNIPAIPHARYRIRLYFRDPWFGKENGGIGGPGSRVFDVACNGVLLMKNFDILAEGNSQTIVKTFENVEASAGGRIELYFMPVVNYAAVNAIEILPED